MMDIMKSGSVDAVLTGEPFVSRMTNAGAGKERRPLCALRGLGELGEKSSSIKRTLRLIDGFAFAKKRSHQAHKEHK